MSKLTNGVPDFLYKLAAIDPGCLPQIQKEAMTLFLQLQKKWLNQKRKKLKPQ
jgi:hypothetical protein